MSPSSVASPIFVSGCGVATTSSGGFLTLIVDTGMSTNMTFTVDGNTYYPDEVNTLHLVVSLWTETEESEITIASIEANKGIWNQPKPSTSPCANTETTPGWARSCRMSSSRRNAFRRRAETKGTTFKADLSEPLLAS